MTAGNAARANEQASPECRQDGADRRHVDAGRAQAARQCDRSRATVAIKRAGRAPRSGTAVGPGRLFLVAKPLRDAAAWSRASGCDCRQTTGEDHGSCHHSSTCEAADSGESRSSCRRRYGHSRGRSCSDCCRRIGMDPDRGRLHRRDSLIAGEPPAAPQEFPMPIFRRDVWFSSEIARVPSPW